MKIRLSPSRGIVTLIGKPKECRALWRLSVLLRRYPAVWHQCHIGHPDGPRLVLKLGKRLPRRGRSRGLRGDRVRRR